MGGYYNIYTYDENGHCITQAQYTSDGSLRTKWNVKENYNDAGKIISMEILSQNGGIAQYNVTEYDESGKEKAYYKYYNYNPSSLQFIKFTPMMKQAKKQGIQNMMQKAT